MAKDQSPEEILSLALQRAQASLAESLVQDSAIRQRIELVALSTPRAAVRLILSCALAAIHNPSVDIRKPYTKIEGPDSFSGRTYDERYLTHFIQRHSLPCNTATAFLTPALRNRNTTITPDLNLVGRSPEIYQAAQQLLDDVYQKRLSAEDLLAETMRFLLIERDERAQRMAQLMKALQTTRGQTLLSAERIVTLVEQHMRLPNSSRLPVLVVAAAYKAAEQFLKERALDLLGHNAADRQTGSLGDIQITLVGDDNVVTCYEMKSKVVTIEDIDLAVDKIAQSEISIDNYVFITTERIDLSIQDYARSLHGKTGIEFVILDCIGFLRHFLHLFYRLRYQFLEQYQLLLLAEPESAVSQALKEAFLAMRLAAERVD